jgi:hypothetical protein
VSRVSRQFLAARTPRIGQQFEGTITAEVVWNSHAEIDTWLRDRLFSIMVYCESEKARSLAQNRADNRACLGLLEPIGISICLFNNGARWRQREGEIDQQCNYLRAEAQAYADDAHAKLAARLAEEARQRAARTPPVSERVDRRLPIPSPLTPVDERTSSRTTSPITRPPTVPLSLVRGWR